MSELFLQNEDNLNSLIVNFNELIKSFSMLSKDKIENVLVTANSIINEGENNIKIMEDEINKLDLQKQFGKKLNNYKLEFRNLKIKFKECQDKYINQKANNIINLGYEENITTDNRQTDIITNNSNNIKSENLNDSKNNHFNKINNYSYDINEKVNIQDTITNDKLNNSLPDFDFNVHRKRRIRKIMLLFFIVGIFIVIVLIGILTLFLTKDNKNNRNNNSN